MARPLVLSNGSLNIGINDYGLVHDFYYPYVGLENHAAGESLRHKIGVWIDGAISWLDDGDWMQTFSSMNEALIGTTVSRNDTLGVSIQFVDFVDAEDNIFFRNISVMNHKDTQRTIRLFLHQAFVIGDSRSKTDTAQYLPSSDAILHYRGDRAFVIGAKDADSHPFDQHSIGLFGIEGREGTYRDADDGELSNGDVEHGRVDSTIRFMLEIEANESKTVQYWIAAGITMRDAVKLHKRAQENGTEVHMAQTIKWWQSWLQPAKNVAIKLPESMREPFLRSTIIVKSQIDNNGAIIASTDTAALKYWRDAYGYCWPRDGAYAIWPLIRMGYKDEPLKFFEFCKEALHSSGYLMHKYRADGGLGSSWHSYRHGNILAPPIQEDETASVLFTFYQYYQANPSADLLEKYYESFVKEMADFMVEHIDEKTHLPKPSYDLWEENFLTTTYTTSVVQAALNAAAHLAEIAKDSSSAVKWRSAADDMRVNAMKLLFDHGAKTFRKGILATEDTIEYHDELDCASFYGAFMYGLVSPESDELKTMRAAIVERLGGGSTKALPRYENDNYMRPEGKQSNGWYICQLWLSQYANEIGDSDTSDELIYSVIGHMSSTGMLSEQFDPKSNKSLSVSPLTWSHAELLSTMLDKAVDPS